MQDRNPELKQLAAAIYTPETVTVIGELADLLEEIGSDVPDLLAKNLLARYENEDPSNTGAQLADGLRQEAIDVIQSHGITMKEWDIRILKIVLDTVLGIENYGSPLDILDIINAELPAVQTFSECAAFFGELSAIEIEEAIEKVDVALINGIREVSTALCAELETHEVSAEIRSIRDRLRAAKPVYENTAIDKMLKGGVALGLNLETYLELTARDDFAIPSFKTNMEGFIKELYLIVLASNVASDAVMTVIKDAIVTSTEEPKERTQAILCLESMI